MVFALSMMLCVQIQSAYTYDTNSVMNVTNHFMKLDAGVWNQLFNTYSSASLHVISLSVEEIAALTNHVVAVIRVGIDIVLMVGIYNNMGFLSKYLILARFTLLFALIQPAPVMFMHFMQWNFPLMMVVGFNNSFHFCGLHKIIWLNMFWVVKYSYNIVVYVVNFVLYVISFIGYTIGNFAEITTGNFLWQIGETTAPMTITTWIKGVSISIALFAILIATQCERVPNTGFYKNWIRAIFPWPYFIR